MSDYISGWEVMHTHYKKEMHTKLELIVLVIHFSLIKHGFRALAYMDDDNVAFDGSIHGSGSEILPPGWNSLVGYNFVLNYIYQNKHYRLRCGSSDEVTVFNLIEQGGSSKITSILLNAETLVASLHGSATTAIPTLEAVLIQLETELLQPFLVSKSRDGQSQTDPERPKKTLASGPPGKVLAGPPRYPEHMHIPTPYGVGASDIYPPLGRPPNVPGSFFPGTVPMPSAPSGGGMIFDPFSRSNQRPPGMGIGRGGPGGPGNVPGARFDPIGPPMPNPLGPFSPRGPTPPDRLGNGGPDPDHLPPPGYEDMFM